MHHVIDLAPAIPLSPVAAARHSPMPQSTPGTHTPSRPIRVAAVSPCFNRRKDIEHILSDLRFLDLSAGPTHAPIDLTFIVVDNASAEPLSTIPIPPQVSCKVIFHRSPINGGGAGGFNAGMRHALETLPPITGEPFDYIWLIDSDCRCTPQSLRALVAALAAHPKLAGVGSALRDPLTGITFEVGGIVDRATGFYRPAAHGYHVNRDALIYCDYLAACSALYRRQALERAGIMPEVFLNGDDVELSLNVSQTTGLQIGATAASVVYHPWRKFQTGARYFIARNSFSPMKRLGLSRFAIFRRGLLDVYRACAQTIMSADELAELHIKGLEDAAAGRISGPAPAGLIPRITMRPFSDLPAVLAELRDAGCKPPIYLHPYLCAPSSGLHEFRRIAKDLHLAPTDLGPWNTRSLGQHLRRELFGAAARLLRGKLADVAIVPTGWPTGWFRGKIQIEVATDGFLIKQISPWSNFFRSLKILFRGMRHVITLTLRSPSLSEIPRITPPNLPSSSSNTGVV
jgi:GT2 family glycosyltransferase